MEWRCGDVVMSMSNQSRPRSDARVGPAPGMNNKTPLKLVGSLYLTEIKQVHSEDDKIIIIDTFEGCILITSLIPAEEVELHHRIFPPMKCTIVCNK